MPLNRLASRFISHASTCGSGVVIRRFVFAMVFVVQAVYLALYAFYYLFSIPFASLSFSHVLRHSMRYLDCLFLSVFTPDLSAFRDRL